MPIYLLLASDMPKISINGLVDQLEYLPQQSLEFHQVVNQVLDKINDPGLGSRDVYRVARNILSRINAKERQEVIQAVLNKISDSNIKLGRFDTKILDEQLDPEERELILQAFLNRLKNPDMSVSEKFNIICIILQNKLLTDVQVQQLNEILYGIIWDPDFASIISLAHVDTKKVPDVSGQLISDVFIRRIHNFTIVEICHLLRESYLPDRSKHTLQDRFIELINDPDMSFGDFVNACTFVYLLKDRPAEYKQFMDQFLTRINDPFITIDEFCAAVEALQGTYSVPVDLELYIQQRFLDRTNQPDVSVAYLLGFLTSRAGRVIKQLVHQAVLKAIPNMHLEDLALVLEKSEVLHEDLVETAEDTRNRLPDDQRNVLEYILVMSTITNSHTPIATLVGIIFQGTPEQSEVARDVLLERINNPATLMPDLLYLTRFRDREIEEASDRVFNERRQEFTIDMLRDAEVLSEIIAIYKFLSEVQKQEAAEYLLGVIEAGDVSRRGGETLLGAIQDRILLDEGQTCTAVAALERLAVLPTSGVAGEDAQEEDATEVHEFIRPIWDKFVAKLKGLSDGLQQMPFGAARRQLQRHIGQLDEPMRRQAKVSFKRLKKCVNLMQNFRDMWPEIVSVLNDDNQPWNPELPEARSRDGRWAYYLLNSFSASGEAYMRAEAGGEGSYSCPEGILERLATGFWGLHQDLDLERVGKTFLDVEEKLERFLTNLQDNPVFLSAANKAGRLGYLLNNFRVLYSIGDETWDQLMRKTQTKRDYLVSLKGEEEEA